MYMNIDEKWKNRYLGGRGGGGGGGGGGAYFTFLKKFLVSTTLKICAGSH